jgi:prepilin-type N-terminal cleavage/methylation domain-containing protein
MIQKNKNKIIQADGFTLIELMIAMVILSLGLFSVIHMEVVTVRGNAYARERTEAYQIATGVVEELRAQALEWVDVRVGADPTFADVFPNIVVTQTADDGALTLADNVKALREYRGIDIATDDGGETAMPINIHAYNTQDFAGIKSSRAIYRIHYLAVNVPLLAGDLPSPDLVRVSIFVSWDNKDHGLQDIDWNNFWDNFWDRHMVVVTCYLTRTRNW